MNPRRGEKEKRDAVRIDQASGPPYLDLTLSNNPVNQTRMKNQKNPKIRAGMAAAKLAGVAIGRPPALTPGIWDGCVEIIQAQPLTSSRALKLIIFSEFDVEISHSTLARYLADFASGAPYPPQWSAFNKKE